MSATPSHNLPAALAVVPDPRSRPGRRHPRVAMLARACCAVLCGCRGYAAVARWGRDRPIELMHRLGYRRTPASFGASRARFARLDAQAFEAAVAGWVGHLLGARPGGLRAVARAGSPSRGRGTPDAPAVYPLAALDQRTGRVPARARVPAETDEHEAALALLEGMALEGRAITGDAASCQRDLCGQVVGDGGHYLIKADDNRPALEADIAAAFEPAGPPRGRRRAAAERDEATSLGQHGGRVERRRPRATTMLDSYLDRPAAAQVARPEREATAAGASTVEVQYLITGAPRAPAGAAAPLAGARGHWGIEDRLPYVAGRHTR